MVTTRLPRLRTVGWLVVPLLGYLVPLFEGYAWNALGSGYNLLDPPEGYTGRLPETRITVEAWGASVIVVPFHARLREYLTSGELPLWNPYQGLGQPFAAQGEGSPYFPLAIVRSLLPYSWANYVTVAMIGLSGFALYRFLIGLGASRPAALFGGGIWPLSGALSLHLARANIADQVAMIPILCWAVAAAVRERSTGRYAVLAAVSALHVQAGFIQIAMLSGLLAVLFGGWYAWLLRPSPRAWARDGALMAGAFMLGCGLMAFSLLPMLEAMRASFSKNTPYLGLLVQTSDANVLGFLMPYLFGLPFHTYWIRGTYPNMIDWDNLYAFSGLLLPALIAAALPGMLGVRDHRRGLFLFFVAMVVILTLRYLSAPPAAALNLLPILDRQSPKHSTGVIAFCLVVAAALAIDALPRTRRRDGRLALAALGIYLTGFTLTVVAKLGGVAATGPSDITLRSVGVTLVVALLVVIAVSSCLGRELGPDRAALALGGMAIAELSLYVPLGNTSTEFLLVRLGLSVAIVVVALLAARGWPRPAAAVAVVALVGYAALVAWPERGLPRQVDLDRPPTFMRWLASVVGPDDRTFGIMPESSSFAGLQDVSVVGPLAPPDFLHFVRMVSDDATLSEYVSSTHFMLASAGPWRFNLEHYARTKPIFDWLGVRYLVLDRAYFGDSSRQDYRALLQDPSSWRVAYEDPRVMVIESSLAERRAELWSTFTIEEDQVAILALLRANPSSIGQPPRVEAAQLIDTIPEPSGAPTKLTVPLTSYRPNEVVLDFDAPTTGLLVLKDVFAEGWSASLDGSDAQLLRVNGLVRGVFIPTTGRHVVRFTYRPQTFVAGVWLSVATAVLVMALAAVALARRRRRPAPHPVASRRRS